MLLLCSVLFDLLVDLFGEKDKQTPQVEQSCHLSLVNFSVNHSPKSFSTRKEKPVKKIVVSYFGAVRFMDQKHRPKMVDHKGTTQQITWHIFHEPFMEPAFRLDPWL